MHLGMASIFISPMMFQTFLRCVNNLYCNNTHHVKDAKEVLDLIKIHKLREEETLITLTGEESSEEDVQFFYDASHVNALGEHFILHCQRYLHGRGHPDHSTYNDLISLANRKAVNDEPTF